MGDFVEKIGYVKNYKLNIHTAQLPYLVVTLTDDENGTVAPVEFNLFRNVDSDAVNKSGRSYLAVSYSNIIQAIIATVKEALIHRKKVRIEYISPPERSSQPEWIAGKNIITSIQIDK